MDNSFDKIRRNNCTLFINKAFRNAELEQALFAGEKKLQERYELTPVCSSISSRVYKFSANFNGKERMIYFKQYLCRSTWDFIKHLVRSSRAMRAFQATLMLKKNGFEAPVIVAMGEHKSSFLDRGNFLVTIEVEGAKQIHQFIPDNLEDFTKEQLNDLRELIRTFGLTVGRMHAAGIFHGDLRLGNILARKEKSGWHFFLIDNERTRKFRRLPARLRLKNLVQANILISDCITKTDRMRFFKTYLSLNPQVQNRRNTWVKKIATKTIRRFRKKGWSQK
ncbi:MAG: lipopolysaccharide kinase InaA family protein [Sedimentisphaerales bacterium]